VPAATQSQSIPVSPSLELQGPTLPVRLKPIDRRVAALALLSAALAVLMAIVAHALVSLIALITNLCFLGRWSFDGVSPGTHHLGWLAIGIPVAGGLVVGVMARYGSKAIRGHGIPEAMEQILTNRSLIPPRITLLKPLSAAISIGTGGPFGAEGPIIASGGALGSLVGQLLRVAAIERRTLLASGAAAGMAATFGTPVSAVLLAIELLLFEYRARSVIPVALAAATAAAVRSLWADPAPFFGLVPIVAVDWHALTMALAIGGACGFIAIGVNRIVYGIESLFERSRIPWPWWPALGGVVVGLVGWYDPRTLGVGYDNISGTLDGSLVGWSIASLVALKALSWSVALGSGTSGGTLAPLLTIGGGLGVLLGRGLDLIPTVHCDLRLAAVVGMAALFAGASRAFLASVVFALETTHAIGALLPLLASCAAAYLIASWQSRHSIMTEKMAKRGVRVGDGYGADPLDRLTVGERCTRHVISLGLGQTVAEAREQALALRFHAYPVTDDALRPRGVITRRDLAQARPEATIREIIRRGPVLAHGEHTLREALDHMLAQGVERLLVVDDDRQGRLVGILTRGDLLGALSRQDLMQESARLKLPSPWSR
jgi:H+/Cl- antiporter ClcA/CBS domain-containing protein